MIPLEKSPYNHLILHKLEMSFGNIYLLEDAVVSELDEGVIGCAEYVYQVLDKALEYYEKHNVIKKRVLIANRTQKYSVQPVEWIRMRNIATKYLSGYCVVDDTKNGILNALLESKFVPINFKSVTTLDDAMKWMAMTQLQQAL